MKNPFQVLMISCLSIFKTTCKKDSVDNINISTIKADINGTSSTFSVQKNLPLTGSYRM
jgi:hypothetical protein